MTIAVSLDDKYTAEEGRVFLTGIQALVRLPMTQMRRDRAAGLNTGAFISGYRGSPLGGLDQQIWAARKFLDPLDIHFQPGVNEDLAATAVWGSQQANLFPQAKYDGVFGMWYGKAPGVDRTGDAFKHANFAGVFPKGGVLAVAAANSGASADGAGAPGGRSRVKRPSSGTQMRSHTSQLAAASMCSGPLPGVTVSGSSTSPV